MSYPGGGESRDNAYGTTPLVTGDAVVLELRPAGFATRAAAIAIDFLVQVIALIALGLVVSWIAFSVDPAATAAISLATTILIIVGYPTAFESISRGRSLGKMALGLRVVGTDGSPERFRQALARALSGFVELWMTFGVIALVTSMLNRDGRRVGDFVAGTMVVEERTGKRRDTVIAMPPHLAAWAAGTELSRLSPETANSARQYVLRYGELAEHTRHEMGIQLADAVAAQVSPPPPPGTTPPFFLAAVLAERRRRSLEAMGQGPQGAQDPQVYQSQGRFPQGQPQQSFPGQGQNPQHRW
ncbi:MAG: RDD family protein [Nocardiopsis sp. BM-2018]|uniref:Putative RDD family membrane protein YckC n=1 Tax=Nocardiopsis metallicus TaxID=179819 RepID=A0A840WLG4_9ACTN|nr:RDD family protein [Nocardiopsis metallicus]MBB5492665.1 putative RDD family membrane protein YckC [Nocardiopsis metallicus]QRN80641.1 MAG: RDD family protein [Nocardiopsis sp. BM-2018]